MTGFVVQGHTFDVIWMKYLIWECYVQTEILKWLMHFIKHYVLSMLLVSDLRLLLYLKSLRVVWR